jgi:hypothetical protein
LLCLQASTWEGARIILLRACVHRHAYDDLQNEAIS